MSKPYFLRLKLGALAGCILLASGCQQQPEPQPVKEQLEHQQEQHETVDLTLMCQKIKKNMADINDQRTTFALEQINQDLKVCLPLLTLAQQKELLQLSTEMYHKFLKVERTPAQQLAFESYAFDMAQHPTIHQSHFEQLTLRDQYLLKHQGQAYVELSDAGSSQLKYRRSPEYLARIFAPYMPEAEKVFIENLANQNIETAVINHTLQIEPFEITRRALFWEDYVQKYPQSSYIRDAKNLLAQYQQYLFIGTSKSPVSDSYTDRYSVQVSSWEEIEKLAGAGHSSLTQQAKKFLNFYSMSEEQRAKSIPSSHHLTPEQQLSRYLNLQQPASHKDCLSDAVCMKS